jgi:hypothetical protein
MRFVEIFSSKKFNMAAEIQKSNLAVMLDFFENFFSQNLRLTNIMQNGLKKNSNFFMLKNLILVRHFGSTHHFWLI